MVDLKKLAIVTSAYTAIKVWPNDQDILDYVATRMPGNWTDLKQIRANLPDIKTRIQEEYGKLWSEAVQSYFNEPSDEVKETPSLLGTEKMIYQILQLDNNTIKNLEDFADSTSQPVEQVISEMVIKAFGNAIAVEVEA